MTERPTGRKIATRLVIHGDLTLLSPAYLGNGDAEGITDMPLLRDAVDGRPLLTGSSIAGALRAYVQMRERGYWAQEHRNDLTTRLFGGIRGDEQGDQSALAVADAYGTLPSYHDAEGHAHQVTTEIRDGVRIDVQQRLADDKKKYDLELLPAGTVFPLTVELALPADPDQAAALQATLAAALHGLEAQDMGAAPIAIGARRSRGLGRGHVRSWTMTTYTLTRRADLLAWLSQDYPAWQHTAVPCHTGSAAALLRTGNAATDIPDQRREWTITSSFLLESSVLIRSTAPVSAAGMQPDATALQSWHAADATARPIIPGTSLAGVLRARATRIVRTLQPDQDAIGDDLIAYLFGRDLHEEAATARPTASRLMVEDALLEDGYVIVQQRVAIDRFTGGAFPTALLSEAPVFGSKLTLHLRFRTAVAEQAAENMQDAAIGLLVLLLKDLWTGDLPIGGTSSIGRGTLRGTTASIDYKDGTNDGMCWTISQGPQTAATDHPIRVERGDPQRLEDYVTALRRYLEQTT